MFALGLTGLNWAQAHPRNVIYKRSGPEIKAEMPLRYCPAIVGLNWAGHAILDFTRHNL